MLKVLSLIAVMIFLTLCAGCSGKQIVKPEIIKPAQAEIPAHPEYLPIQWQKTADKYCVDADNAKAILINNELCRGWGNDLETILKGQRIGDIPKKKETN